MTFEIEQFVGRDISSRLPFERRYPRETVERIKAMIREIGVLVDAGAVMPSFRAMEKFFLEEYQVSISRATVQRLYKKLCTAPTTATN